MDLLPITDLTQSAQIAHYGELANDKLKEAQGIVQSALDVHMLLSHYDAYKQFTQNLGDTVGDVVNDIKTNILPSGGDSAFDPFAAWDYGQQQIKKAKSTIKQVKQTFDDVVNEGNNKYQSLKDEATANLQNAKNEFNTQVNTVKAKVGDAVEDIQAKGQEVKDNLGSVAKKINDDAEEQFNNAQANIKSSTQSLEDQLKSMTMGDPAESLTARTLTSEELGRVGMLKNPVLNDYYARKVFPDDIFADEPAASNITISPYKAATKIKKVVKKLKKPKKQQEEEQPKQAQDETPTDTGTTLSPQGQDTLFPMREMMAKRAAQAEEMGENPNADIPNMSEEELATEISNMAGGARSPMAEERFQQLNQRYSQITKEKQQPEIEEPRMSTLDEDTTAPAPQNINSFMNEGEELLNTTKSGVAKVPQMVTEQTRQLADTAEEQMQNITNNIQNGIEDAKDQMRTFSTNLSSKLQNAISGGGEEEEGGEDVISSLKKALLGDTEESLAGDEDPIGLAVTVGLGLADLGTQIAGFFDKPKTPTIAIQSQQVGV